MSSRPFKYCSNSINPHMLERVKHYVRELYENKFIIDNVMPYKPFKTYYKTIQVRDNFECPITYFVTWLVHLKLAVKQPKTGKLTYLDFNADLLSTILNNNEPIINNSESINNNNELIKLYTSTTPLDQRKKIIICETCKKKFAKKRALKFHQVTKHGLHNTLILAALEQNKKEICTTCKKKFLDKKTLEQHQKASKHGLMDKLIALKEKRKECIKSCERKFTDKIGLKSHQNAIHGLIPSKGTMSLQMSENVAPEYDHMHVEAPLNPVHGFIPSKGTMPLQVLENVAPEYNHLPAEAPLNPVHELIPSKGTMPLQVLENVAPAEYNHLPAEAPLNPVHGLIPSKGTMPLQVLENVAPEYNHLPAEAPLNPVHGLIPSKGTMPLQVLENVAPEYDHMHAEAPLNPVHGFIPSKETMPLQVLENVAPEYDHLPAEAAFNPVHELIPSKGTMPLQVLENVAPEYDHLPAEATFNPVHGLILSKGTMPLQVLENVAPEYDNLPAEAAFNPVLGLIPSKGTMPLQVLENVAPEYNHLPAEAPFNPVHGLIPSKRTMPLQVLENVASEYNHLPAEAAFNPVHGLIPWKWTMPLQMLENVAPEYHHLPPEAPFNPVHGFIPSKGTIPLQVLENVAPEYHHLPAEAPFYPVHGFIPSKGTMPLQVLENVTPEYDYLLAQAPFKPVHGLIPSIGTMPLQVLENVTPEYDYLHAEAPFKPVYGLIPSIGTMPLQVLQNVGPEYDYLHAEAPFKPVHVLSRDEYNVIINGRAPKALPKQYAKCNTRITLKQYTFPPSITQILKCSLNDIGKLSQANKYLLKTLTRLLSVENPLNALTPNNYCELLKYLLYIEENQMNKDIRNFDMETTDLEYISNEDLYKLRVPGLGENRPSIIVRDSVFVKLPDRIFKYEGIVHHVEKDCVVLGFNNRFKDVFIRDTKVLINFSYNRYSIRTEHQAVELIKKLDLSNSFFPLLPENRPLRDFTYNWFDSTKVGENKEQQQAVKHIISKTSLPAPYLIFGPPGTGKTTTIVECIQQIRLLLPNDKILICTPSNNAANVITKRLLNIPKSELLRYVAESAPYTDLKDAGILDYCNYDREGFYSATQEVLVKYRIIVTTLVTAARLYNNGIPANHFSYVFIDEAGHATETETLIPIAGIGYCDKNSPNNTQVVLIGDPKQLGPIIYSKLALHYGFAISMLERFMNTQEIYQRSNGEYNKNVLTKLLKNYRSHEYIIEVSKQRFYDNELHACNKDMAYVAIGHTILPNSKFPLIFHSAFGRDEQEESSPSFFNVLEISVIFDYLKKLIGTTMGGIKIGEEHIAVISPYSRQVKKIDQHCFRMHYAKLAVGTVEQFQGQQKLIVIISTVRSSPDYMSHDHKYHLGFLKNPRRMNIALTRAQALVIVIGNPSLLQYDENWYAFMKYCKDNSSFIGSYFDLPSSCPNLPNVTH